MGLEADDAESLGHNQKLLLQGRTQAHTSMRGWVDMKRVDSHLLVGRGDTLEDLQAGKSIRATAGLVVDHATGGAPEHAAGRAQMVGTASGVGVRALAEECKVLHCSAHVSNTGQTAVRARSQAIKRTLVAEEGAGDVDLLSANNGDVLACWTKVTQELQEWTKAG